MEQTYKKSQFNFWHKVKATTYLYNTFTTGLIKLNEEYVDKIKATLEDPNGHTGLTSPEFDMLKDNGFILPSSVDEIDLVKFRYHKGVFDNSVLGFTFVPTKECNFNCSYCFEHDKIEKSMTPEDINGIEKFVENELKASNPKQFSILWYGGEPLLRVDIIEELTSRVDAVCKKAGVNFNSAGIITNGYLLDKKMAEKLRNLKINTIQITLDGNKETHNKARPLKDGGGTFDKVMAGIKVATEHFDGVAVRINTNKKNQENILKLLEQEEILRSPKVNISIGRLMEFLGGNVTADQDCDYFSSVEHYDFQNKVNNILGRQRKDDKKTGPLFRTSANYCGADQYKSYIIGPDCLVYKCAEKLNRGDEVGVIKGGKLIPNAMHWEWFKANVFKSEPCLKCALLPVCMGGCISRRMQFGGSNKDNCGRWQKYLSNMLDKM